MTPAFPKPSDNDEWSECKLCTKTREGRCSMEAGARVEIIIEQGQDEAWPLRPRRLR